LGFLPADKKKERILFFMREGYAPLMVGTSDGPSRYLFN
jgi:hypothetical protein